MRVNFSLNGKKSSYFIEAGETLLELLKKHGVASLRKACDGEGSCGSCLVLMDGKAVNSCQVLAAEAEGALVLTVEHFSRERKLTVIQQALVDAGAVQCGYCIPATVLAIHELLERDKDPDIDGIKDALSGILCRCTGYQQQIEGAFLAAKRLRDPGYHPKDMPEFRPDLAQVGKRREKVDAYALVRGEKAYVEDRVEPGACLMKFLGSPYARANIAKIDTAKAEAFPGVVAVLTYRNCPDVLYTTAGQGYPEPSPYDRRMFARQVLHVGDRVACVLAEDERAAMEALRLIEVEYEELPPLLSIEEAAAPGAQAIHEADKVFYQFSIGADPSRNLAASAEGSVGNVEKALSASFKTVEREYETSWVHCTPLEPHTVYVRPEGGRLTIHASTQVPWHVRRIVARLVGISENRIRVIKERVGGGFGAKQDIVGEEVAAYLAWTTGKSVYYRMTREEEFIQGRTRHPMKIRVRMGADSSGKLLAIDMKIRANTGAYGTHALTVPMNACSKSLPLFVCDNVAFRVESYYTNLPVAAAYQGYGAPQGSFAIQSAFAELASELGIDLIETIERNRVREGSRIEILKALGEGREGQAVTVGKNALGEMLARGKKEIGWGIREDVREGFGGSDSPPSDPDIKIGKACVIIQQGSGLPGLDSANAQIRLLQDGTFLLLSGGADLGTGLDTVTVKLAAEALCVNMERIAVISGDTDATPFDKGAYASSGTFFSGNAALIAAKNLKTKILAAASEMLGEPLEGLSIESPGIVRGGKGSIGYADIAARSPGGTEMGELSASGSFATEHAAFPYGAHFCQVSVNGRTGEIVVDRYLAYQDCGTPINPELAMGQIYGGVLKAIGHSLYEEMKFDEKGRCLNPNFLDYKVPSIFEVPKDFRVELVPAEDPVGPYGAKSVAEISVNGAACAIAQAIHDATGIRMRKWPFTPEEFLRAAGRL